MFNDIREAYASAYYGMMCRGTLTKEDYNELIERLKSNPPPTPYERRKEAAREKAIAWQHDFENHNYSHGELIEWQSYFERIGRRYGLLREFRENGIL